MRYIVSAAVCFALGGYCFHFPFQDLYRLDSSNDRQPASIAADGNSVRSVDYQFLGIPVRSVSYANITETVSPGGTLVGLALQSRGLRILGSQFVETEDGEINTLQNSDIRINDLLISLNGTAVNTQNDVARALCGVCDNSVSAKLLRGGRIIETTIGVAVNRYSGAPSLGLWVKDHMSGIGTLSFVCDQRFAALGHAVKDESNEIFPTNGGALYPCELLGIQTGSHGTPGYVKGTFSYNAIQLGEVRKNNEFGLYGSVRRDDLLGTSLQKTLCCPRQEIKLGKATLLSAVSGALRSYEIEIVKAAKQKSPQTKSMVVRVTDPDLISLTGGIVQGMSGSPILQNGKFVGALTHVFNSDPTKGFALYGDWMLQEIRNDC